MRPIWKGFPTWIEIDQEDAQEDLDKTIECVSNLREEVSEENMNYILNETPFVKVVELLSEYLQHLRNGNGTLSTFWMPYKYTVEVLFNMISASRECDWQLHLASVRAWYFA